MALFLPTPYAGKEIGKKACPQEYSKEKVLCFWERDGSLEEMVFEFGVYALLGGGVQVLVRSLKSFGNSEI